jgi:hypothetical protein
MTQIYKTCTHTIHNNESYVEISFKIKDGAYEKMWDNEHTQKRDGSMTHLQSQLGDY